MDSRTGSKSSCHVCCQGTGKMPRPQAKSAATSLESPCNLGQESIARTSAVTFFLAPHLSTWKPQARGISPHSFLLLVGRGTPLRWLVWEAACLQGECVLVCSQPYLGSLSCWEPAASSAPLLPPPTLCQVGEFNFGLQRC